jgi:hypothetical protein
MKSLRTGVIGCGHLGKYHAQLLSGLVGVTLVGVYDSQPAAAANLAQKHNCKNFTSAEELLSSVDAVTVATPAISHYQVVKPILEKMIPVLVEKPITADSAQASELISIAQKNRVIFCVGHVERFNPAFKALMKETIAPQFLEIHRLAAFKERGTDVDVILDLMIHDIDLVFCLSKTPLQKVDASGGTVISKNLDIVNARLQFEGGCAANLTASRISQKNMRKFRLFQKGAYYSLDFSDPSIEIYQMNPNAVPAPVPIDGKPAGLDVAFRMPELPEANALEDELAAFVESVRQGKIVNGIATAEEATRALKVAEEIRRCCLGEGDKK